jgi:hypothetical protein
MSRTRAERACSEFPISVREFTLSDWWVSYHGADPEEGDVDAGTEGLRPGKRPHQLANNLGGVRGPDSCVDHPNHRSGQSF